MGKLPRLSFFNSIHLFNQSHLVGKIVPTVSFRENASLHSTSLCSTWDSHVQASLLHGTTGTDVACLPFQPRWQSRPRQKPVSNRTSWKVAQRSYRKLNGKMVRGYISMRFTCWGTVSRSKVFCSWWKPVFVEFLDITNYYILPRVFTASWHHSPHINTPRTNPPASGGKCTPTTSFHDVEVAAILGCLWFWVWEFPLSSCILTLLELTIPKPPRPTAKKNVKKNRCF